MLLYSVQLAVHHWQRYVWTVQWVALF